MNDLPEHLRDPMKVLERGRQLEESGGVKLSSKERDLSEYLGKDREELRTIIGERDDEIERLQLEAQQWKSAFTAECHANDRLRASHEPPVVCGPELAHAMDKLGAIVNGQSERITPIEANALLINWRQLQSDARAAQPPLQRLQRPFTPDEAKAYRAFIEEYFELASSQPPSLLRQFGVLIYDTSKAAEDRVREMQALWEGAEQPPSADADAAAKWRALRNCARITAIGSAGCHHGGDSFKGPTAHLTLNFWTHNAREHETYHREWLDVFVEKAVAAQTKSEPSLCACDAPYRQGYECYHPHVRDGITCRRLAGEKLGAA